MSKASPTAVQALIISRVVAGPRTDVFKAWTDPEELKRWWGPPGFITPSAEIDLRAGGKYRIAMKPPDGEVMYVGGVYREVKRPEKLVYTWAWEEDGGPGHESLVTVEFRDRDGSTEVIVTHERLPDAESRERHSQGWTGCIDQLVALFA